MALNPKHFLTQTGLAAAAKRLRTGLAEIRALAKVESSGQGFDDEGRVVIRFEPHVFHEKTNGKYSASHPHLSYKDWDPKVPRSLDHSWRLFKEACTLDATAAVLSTSWGMFQVMGFNFTRCSCKTLKEFVAKMENSVDDQLALTVELLMSSGMAVLLRTHKWAELALRYNGKGYKKNQYDTKLEHWFWTYSR
jgi:hypothetical protein